MLTIRNLHVSVEDKAILKGIDLEVKAGEVHALMGRMVLARARLPKCLRAAKAIRLPRAT